MRILTTLLIGACVCTIAMSQSLSPQLIASAGGSASAENVQIDWSVGETAVTTIGTNPMLTQGFHQGYLQVTSLPFTPELMDIVAYPNPVSSRLTIEISSTDEMTFELFDSKGSLVHQSDQSGPKFQVDMSPLASGLYIGRLYHDKQVVGIIKVDKFSQ